MIICKPDGFPESQQCLAQGSWNGPAGAGFSKGSSRKSREDEVTQPVALQGKRAKPKIAFVAKKPTSPKYFKRRKRACESSKVKIRTDRIALFEDLPIDRMRHSGREGRAEVSAKHIRFLLVTAVFMIGAWFIPEAVILHAAFSRLALGAASMLEIIDLLAVPIAVLAALFALLLPIGRPAKLVITAICSLSVIALPMLLGKQVLPVEGPLVVVACLVASLCAAFAASFLDAPFFGCVTLLLIPIALLGAVLTGHVSGAYAAGFVASFRELVQLCAGIAVLTISATGLFDMAN